jgi:hypothetical protein
MGAWLERWCFVVICFPFDRPARVRLTPRCSGRHPGDLSNVLASGGEQPWLRSAARPGGAAELIVRYTTLRFLGELPPSRAVGQHPLPLSTVRLAIVGSGVQTRIHYAFSACSTDLPKLRRTPSLQRLQPPNRVEASSNPSLQRTPPVRFRTLVRLAPTVNGFVKQTQRVR